jgi:hypothetical protein
MYYIYKFTNNINQKVYIGQTNNIENATKANTPVTKTAVDFFKAKQR